MKLLQLLDAPAVGVPRLEAIQKRIQDHSSVYGNLGGEADAVDLPKSFCQSTKGRSSLSKALHHHSVQGFTACNGATQIIVMVMVFIYRIFYIHIQMQFILLQCNGEIGHQHICATQIAHIYKNLPSDAKE